jgi:hypothetical protein
MSWLIAARGLAKRYAPGAARWLISKLGGDWIMTRVDNALSSAGERQKAITKARQFGGRLGAILVEGRGRYVVYSGDKPIDIFPPIKGSLVEATEHYDTELLREPSDLASARARAWGRSRFRDLAGRLRRGEVESEVFEAETPEAGTANVAAAEERLGGEAFEKVIEQMQPLLERLTSAPAKPVGEHDTIPAAPGIYFFSEGPNPIYVGQSRSIRQRLKQHTSAKSHENQAPLAFNIALKEAEQQNLALPRTRKEIEADPAFQPLFAAALARVAAMKVQFVELDDPVTRTIFEVYAARSLGSDEFNTWETH